MNLYETLRMELMMKMRMMDTTLKHVKESSEYKEACIYNKGIRDALQILNNHKEQLSQTVNQNK